MTRSQKKKTVNSNEVTVNRNENSLILDIVNIAFNLREKES